MKLTLNAPAKVNLCLKVVGGLPDGRHELFTVMQPVSIFDMLTITDQTDGLSLTCDDESLAVEDNLVLKAARAWFEAADIAPKAAFHLRKRIPVAAGLGGGVLGCGRGPFGLERHA